MESDKTSIYEETRTLIWCGGIIGDGGNGLATDGALVNGIFEAFLETVRVEFVLARC